MSDPKLEIRCNIASAAKARTNFFLTHYMLSIEGTPYAINTEFVCSANEHVAIFPVEGARIAAIIPVQGSKLGSFEGANFQRDVPRQIAITLGEFKYIVYENPQTETSSKRKAARGREGSYVGPGDEAVDYF